MRKPLGESGENLFRDLVNGAVHMIEQKELFVIHCSAGIGRTGTLGTMIEAVRSAKETKALSVFKIVDNMRRHRIGCVQTFEQYQFIYHELQKML
jgi:protein tyrosine phosphatase